MQVLTVPVAMVFVVLTALAFGLIAQRLLGIRLGLVRLLLGGAFALAVNGPILVALLSDYQDREPTTADLGPALAWVLLAMATTVLASMIFLVMMEAFVPLGSLPPALVWGRGLRGRLARTRRYWQIVGIGLRNGLGPYIRDTRRRALDDSGGRRHLGLALRNTLNAGGVTFVKIGQILSTRRDLLPAEIVDELSSLQDRAAPVPWQQIRAVLHAELGDRTEHIFASIEPEPLAAASVGQVHAARLVTGEDVVVKIQRPGIRPIVERDLDILRRLADRLHSGTSWGRTLGLRSIADGLTSALREELDYRIEADNIDAVAVGSGGRDATVRILTVYPSLCTERVLVMERIHGTPLGVAGPVIQERGLDGTALARALLDVLLRQIMLDGIFHADPHAGNVILEADGRLALLDFGSVGRLDAGLRDALQRLLMAVDRGDPLGTADALLELVPRPDTVDEQRLERDLGRFLARNVGPTGGSTVRMFGDLFRIVAEHRLSIPPELAAVLRALGTAEGTVANLDPRFDVVTEARALTSTYAGEQLQPDTLRDAARDELVALVPVLRRLPRRIERIASAAEHGRLALNVRLLADERDREVITGLLHQVLLAFLAGVVGIMAVLLIGTDGGPMVTESIGLHALLGYNLLVVSGILGVRVLAAIFRRAG